MALTRSQVLARANASISYPVRMCMKWTRLMAGQEAVGDYDGDKAADAEDGWKSSSSKHPGDRNPPAGTMVFYGGGSSDNGHAAISKGPNALGEYWIRGTDSPKAGYIGSVPLDWPEKNWGMPYLGWTDGIGDARILNDLPVVEVQMTRGKRIDEALRKLRKAVKVSTKGRRNKIQAAIDALKSIKPRRKD